MKINGEVKIAIALFVVGFLMYAAYEAITDGISSVSDAVTNEVTGLGTTLSDDLDSATNSVKSVATSVTNLPSTIGSSVSSWWSDSVQWVEDKLGLNGE